VNFVKIIIVIALSLASTVTLCAAASDQATATDIFLSRVFTDAIPPSNMLWVSGERKTAVAEILRHQPEYLRLRYWGNAQRSAWIVDEIGKTEPITFGIVIHNNQIESVEVLVFRESRGWEIQHDFFSRQFTDAKLLDNKRLDRPIDGISGATLSVKAMQNVSRMVLYLTGSLPREL